jgi:hypothetical protein
MLQKIMMKSQRRRVVGLKQIASIAIPPVEHPELLASKNHIEDIAATFGERARALFDHVRMRKKHIRNEVKQGHQSLLGSIKPLLR